MLGPKHIIGKSKLQVKSEFINREDAKKLFKSKLTANNKQFNVISYYGIGGIGKSSLSKELIEIHKIDNTNNIIMYVDLTPPEDRNMGNAILKLADSCGVSLISFELAYAIYFIKKHPQVAYGREKEGFTNSKFIGTGLNILSLFDGGLTSSIGQLMEKVIVKVKNHIISSDIKDALLDFSEKDLSEMEEMLPAFLSYDINKILTKEKDKKLLIMIDTFEALNEDVFEKHHKSKNEEWIREIITYFPSDEIPSAIFCILGRDKIEWGDEWDEVIEDYQLKEFDRKYSLEYLKQYQIEHPELVESIIKSSKGHPFLLYLSGETYTNILNKGLEPTVVDFAGSEQKVIERFLYNLDKETVNILRIMSIPNYYDNELFCALMNEYKIPSLMFEQFNKYSFISLNTMEKKYYINDLIRERIFDKNENNLKKEIHAHVLSYYSRKVINSELIKNKVINNSYLVEIFFHAINTYDIAEFNNWFYQDIEVAESKITTSIKPIDLIEIKQKEGSQNILNEIITMIISKFGLQNIDISIVYTLIDIIHLGGEYESAVLYIDDYLSSKSEFEKSNEQLLIKMQIRKIHHSMFYKPVDKLIEETKEILNRLDFSQHPEAYNEVLFLIGGNLGVLSGKFEMCKEYLEKSMTFAKANGLTDFESRTIRKQADICLYEGKTAKAEELLSYYIKIDSKIITRYEIYLTCVLGEVYRKLGKIEDAETCYKKVKKESSERNLPGWKAHAELGIALIELEKDNIELSEQSLKNAKEIYKKIGQKWGEINSKTIGFMIDIKKDVELNIDNLEALRYAAQEQNYRYNENYLNELILGEKKYFQLFFL